MVGSVSCGYHTLTDGLGRSVVGFISYFKYTYKTSIWNLKNVLINLFVYIDMLMKCSIKLIIHYTSACGDSYLMGNILGLVACFRVLHFGNIQGY